MKYSVAIDFDGVLHSYQSPWIAAHIIPDEAVPGAISWLNHISSKFSIIIFTTRAKTWRGRRAVLHWLKEKGFQGNLVVSYKKLPALIYIDDRAWRFDGTFPTVQDIHRARPWNKK